MAAATKSANGCVEEHALHSAAAGPTQVAHEPAHGTQTSAVELEPPAHVKPASIDAQSAAHPSRASWSPSSHASLPTRSPSPQTSAQVEAASNEPPLHANPTSTAQLASQPSPAAVLLSSQPSALAPHRMRRPSPQMGAHVSTPPTPEPPLPSVLETHAKPTSRVHSAEQPSPPAVLLSSHASAVERTPLPQMCTGATYATASTSVSLPAATASSVAVATVVSRASSVWSVGSYGDSPADAVVTPTETPSDASTLSRRPSPPSPPPPAAPPPSTESPEALTTMSGCGPTCGGSPSE